MRIIFATLLISLLALPIMAKAFDSAQSHTMASRLMSAVNDDLRSGDSSAEVTAMAEQFNAIDVGSTQ